MKNSVSRFRVVLFLALSAFLLTTPANASDHVRTGSENGKPNFGNSNPQCVPGEGDPKSGTERGIPARGSASCRQN